MPEQTSCTPEGGLEALADALFTHHRLDIPCQGEGRHVPLTKDKAGRKDVNGRLYRYWTCPRCQPRTKRNCRSYINEAERVLGREAVDDLASTVLDERRSSGQPYDLLDAWLRGKLTPTTASASSQSQRKRKLAPLDRDKLGYDTSSKRSRVCSDSGVSIDEGKAGGDAGALQSAYAAREAIDRVIATLTGARPPAVIDPTTPTPPARSSFDVVPLDDESDSDEVILLPTPPNRAPLRSLTTNVPDPHPSRSSPDTLPSLIRRFRQASEASARNAVRKEAKSLGLAAEFERERSKPAKPPSVSRPSAASHRLRECPGPTESQMDRGDRFD